VNTTVPSALSKLGYPAAQIKTIIDYVNAQETIEGAPYLKEKDLPVFDCAFKPAKGHRANPLHGPHQDDGAVQPFLSGAISKTVNVPKDATPEDIMQAYVESWRLGVKAIAIYRDAASGCSR